jgi:Zn-dependent metalloprotease
MCTCHCFIVPPFIESRLARNRRIKNLSSRRISGSFRRRRKDKIAVALQAATIRVIPDVARRLVYDSQHSTRQRLLLRRPEGNKPIADDADVNTAYDHAGVVRDYFQKNFAYNSWDNQGSDLVLNIHFSEEYNNAFWDGDEMTFGDGDGKIFTSFVNAIDVTAHELAHGVVQTTAGLVYQGQPGALNEHFADVFGSVIKQSFKKQTAATADWLIGDAIMAPNLHGQAIRSMKSPGSAYDNPLMGKDPQPGHMDDYYKGAGDNYGVHINSGIPNKVFYIVSNSISTRKAGLLWFETLNKLDSKATFKQFKTAIIKTSQLMMTNGQLPSTTGDTVASAFSEVGL